MKWTLGDKWQAVFLETVQRHDIAGSLKEAALKERLGDWTQLLTSIVVETCEKMGWNASAKGHRLDLLPVRRSEYMGLDVVAFGDRGTRWRFPVAVIELENSRDDDQIAYSLWKVLFTRADLRIVFCYRRDAHQGSALIRFLRDELVNAMGLGNRIKLEGETLMVVGSRDESATFPYAFFKWWRLDQNTGTFGLM